MAKGFHTKLQFRLETGKAKNIIQYLIIDSFDISLPEHLDSHKL